MRSVALYVEDLGHERFLAPLVSRLAQESGVEVTSRIISARRGHGAVLSALERDLADLARGIPTPLPDLLVVAIDGNCRGYSERIREIKQHLDPTVCEITVCAVPDPHIERWMLVDSAAFKLALGKGCQAPDQKCERDRYKRLLNEAVLAAGLRPLLGGFEHAEAVVTALDIQRTAQLDASFRHFVTDLRAHMHRWQGEAER